MSACHQAERTLREMNVRLTPQRLAVLEYLEGNLAHPSAAEIHRALADRFPMMSFATVYNTLEMLREQGLVRELAIDPDKKRFDPNMEPHHHLICLSCKRIVDVFCEFDLTLPEGARGDFEVIGNQVDFYGICPRCSPGGEGVKSNQRRRRS
jgi:Fur family transcriptional regulator, peroxide stress response regulator